MTVFGPRWRVLVMPSATIARVAASLKSHGRIPRGDLGLRLVAIEGGRLGLHAHGDGLVNHFASERD
jgi:S1-C subfamily serine protease